MGGVQAQRLATEPQEQGQELGAEVVGHEVPREGLPRLTPPSSPPLSGQGENDRVELSRKEGLRLDQLLRDPPRAGMRM